MSNILVLINKAELEKMMISIIAIIKKHYNTKNAKHIWKFKHYLNGGCKPPLTNFNVF